MNDWADNAALDQVVQAMDGRRETPGEGLPRSIVASPYHWRDPASIPPRQFLYGRHLIRKMVSATIAPGGTIKTTLAVIEALAMISGKNLLGQNVGTEPLRVWLYNLEDPVEELARRIQAACLRYNLTPGDLGDRLFLNSGRDQPLVTATITKTGPAIAQPVVAALTAELISKRIDVLVIDPFISSHAVPENDNGAIDLVTKEWGRIADHSNCAVDLVHHTRKLAGSDVTAESSRGAKALTDTTRSARVINRMTEKEAEQAEVEHPRLYHRVFNDKANLAPPSERSEWFKLESIDLGNGDNVGVIVPWQWPNPFDDVTRADLVAVQKAIEAGTWKESSQSKTWVGMAVADVLGLDVNDASARKRIKNLLKTWISNRMLKVVRRLDATRHESPFIEVDQWATK